MLLFAGQIERIGGAIMLVLTAKIEPRNRAVVCRRAYDLKLQHQEGYDPEMIWVPGNSPYRIQHISPVQARIAPTDVNFGWNGYWASHFIAATWELPRTTLTLERGDRLRITFDDSLSTDTPSVFIGLGWLLIDGTIEIIGGTCDQQRTIIALMHDQPPTFSVRQPDFETQPA